LSPSPTWVDFCPVRVVVCRTIFTDPTQIAGGIIWVNGKIILILHWLGRTCARCCRCLRDCLLCRCCRRSNARSAQQRGRLKSSTAGDVAMAAGASGSALRESNNNNSQMNADRSPDKSGTFEGKAIGLR
jgi:hypothetical protein